MKKFIVVFIALLMIFSMCSSVFAGNSAGYFVDVNICIGSPDNAQILKTYKIKTDTFADLYKLHLEDVNQHYNIANIAANTIVFHSVDDLCGSYLEQSEISPNVYIYTLNIFVKNKDDEPSDTDICAKFYVHAAIDVNITDQGTIPQPSGNYKYVGDGSLVKLPDWNYSGYKFKTFYVDNSGEAIAPYLKNIPSYSLEKLFPGVDLKGFDIVWYVIKDHTGDGENFYHVDGYVEVLPDEASVEEPGNNADEGNEISYQIRHIVNGNPEAIIVDSVIVNASMPQKILINKSDLASKETDEDAFSPFYGYTFDKYIVSNTEYSSVLDMEKAGIIDSEGMVNNATVIDVHYKINENLRVNVSYTVNHYLNGRINTTYTDSTSIQALSEHVMNMNYKYLESMGSSNAGNAFYGYKLDRYEVDSTKFDNIQAMKAGGIINDSGKVKDGVVINAYYAPDPDITKNITYTVEYYLAGRLSRSATEKFTASVQALKNYITVGSLPKKEFSGYYFTGSSCAMPANVRDGDVIKMYYSPVETASSTQKTLSYTVSYYLNGVHQPKEDVKISSRVSLSEPDTIKVNSVDIKRFAGYKFEKINTDLPATVKNGAVIKIYYTQDKGNDTAVNTAVTVKSVKSWALVNLVLMILTVIAQVYIIFRESTFAFDAVDEKLKEELNAVNSKNKKRKAIGIIIGLVIAVAAIVVFVLTENMKLKMILADKWTILMFVIFIVQILNMLLTKRKRIDKNQNARA